VCVAVVHIIVLEVRYDAMLRCLFLLVSKLRWYFWSIIEFLHRHLVLICTRVRIVSLDSATGRKGKWR
jgi:hypothetical protein